MDAPLLWIALDRFFLVFHTLLSLFNAVGWIWARTRRLYLAAIGATAFSWFVLGYWHGWGFCFCTEWHWRVRERLGRPAMSHSYIHFLVRELSGWDAPPALVDATVGAVFAAALAMSAYLNIRGLRAGRGGGGTR